MQGRRIYRDDSDNYWLDRDQIVSTDTGPGDYWCYKKAWYGRTPVGSYCNLSGHTVIEHADETITVTPSILVTAPHQPDQNWHGYLEQGVWRAC